ncbi:MAG: tannase/feruloyl esterase family alpha/beta hydrolase [Burkholderiaceae bacterium]|nr:tannase/feruloyl esterase family alpha/beta hydrolase [Burkholderiaceae bacterium]
MRSALRTCATAVAAAAALSACLGDDDNDVLPQLAEASGTSLKSCAALTTAFSFANTSLTAASDVAAGTLTVAGKAVPAHCLVTGSMYPRTGVNGNYAIGFEMRLPAAWNGRFFYQANGGADGNVVTATGGIGGGGSLSHALAMGFAVISSDAGHNAAQNAAGTAHFGNDPQARLDFGYQAVAKLTPMAKGLIASAYGKGPDRSYIGGCSNGGRHTMVAAARYPEQYDGFLVGNPGTNLPKAATANIAGFQKYLTLASTAGDASTGFTLAERSTVSNAVLAKCDALDGASDGLIQDTTACQAAFDLNRDVPTCSGARDGSCLTTAQKTVIAQLFAGAQTSTGAKIYASWPYDNGFATAGWSFWKFTVPNILDSVAVGQIFQSPPETAAGFVGPVFAATGSVDAMVSKIAATSGNFSESSLSFMTPPNPSDLSKLKQRGAKLMLFHGTADPIFSSDDSTAWYESLISANAGNAAAFARFYRVPGMGHCSGGPSTDQFDMLSSLVAWVEKGQVPGAITASARGAGNAGGANADVPAGWSATRTRPLCAYPQVARYNGSGSLEEAASFTCR